MRRNLMRRGRRRGRWLVPAVFALLALPAAADYVNGWVKGQGDCRVARVVDGDTLAIDCQRNTATRLRFTGIDTPEVKAACFAESLLAFRATWFTRWQLWTAGEVEIRADGGRDRYGRALGTVVVDGNGLEARLLAGGLAVPYTHGGVSWCERIERGQA